MVTGKDFDDANNDDYLDGLEKLQLTEKQINEAIEGDYRAALWRLNVIEKTYAATNNPIYIWEALLYINERNPMFIRINKQIEMPLWINEYLLRVANNLVNSTPPDKDKNHKLTAKNFEMISKRRSTAYSQYHNDKVSLKIAMRYESLIISEIKRGRPLNQIKADTIKEQIKAETGLAKSTIQRCYDKHKHLFS